MKPPLLKQSIFRNESGLGAGANGSTRGWICGLLVLLASAGAGRAETVVLDAQHPQFGKTYSQWASAWWQWAFAIPASENPLRDATGQNAERGQHGPVFFLAGTQGGNAVRTVTVPERKALFFPVQNSIWIQTPSDTPPSADCIKNDYVCFREQIRPFQVGSTLACEVDGVSIPNLTSYLIDSTLFGITAPENNILADFGLTGGTYDLCVDNGYYLMLAPLSAGAHTIHFSAKTADASFSLDVQYNLTVALAAADTSRLIAVGDSLLAGFRDGGLVDVYQRDGIAAVVARQAQTTFPQPLIGWPGLRPVLVIKNAGPPPVIEQASGSSTGRVDLFTQPFNLAVPAQTVSDALRLHPDAPFDTITDLILGLPGLLGGVSRSQVEWAEALAPTTLLLWIGNNDALNAAIAGDPSAMTSEASFAADYTTLIDRLAATGATIAVANIPDVTTIPYVQPAPNVAALLGVPFSIFSSVLGVAAEDRLNLDAVAEAGAILQGVKPPPLGAQFILTPSEISAIQDRTAKFNAVIAQQARQKGAIMVDTAALLAGWKASGADLPGKHLTTDFLGGIFSLDGIHPTSEGAALTANAFIKALDTSSATIPQVAWLGVVRAGDKVTVQWNDGAAGYELQTSDSLTADSWTTLMTLPADRTEQQFSTGVARTFFRLRH